MDPDFTTVQYIHIMPPPGFPDNEDGVYVVDHDRRGDLDQHRVHDFEPFVIEPNIAVPDVYDVAVAADDDADAADADADAADDADAEVNIAIPPPPPVNNFEELYHYNYNNYYNNYNNYNNNIIPYYDDDDSDSDDDDRNDRNDDDDSDSDDEDSDDDHDHEEEYGVRG